MTIAAQPKQKARVRKDAGFLLFLAHSTLSVRFCCVKADKLGPTQEYQA
jgi:hypothetical protein